MSRSSAASTMQAVLGPRQIASAVGPAHGQITARQWCRGRRIFRFRDDFVVRVRPDGEATRVDMRSKSRVGKGDLGANAKRIEQFFQGLASRAGGSAEKPAAGR